VASGVASGVAKSNPLLSAVNGAILGGSQTSQTQALPVVAARKIIDRLFAIFRDFLLILLAEEDSAAAAEKEAAAAVANAGAAVASAGAAMVKTASGKCLFFFSKKYNFFVEENASKKSDNDEKPSRKFLIFLEFYD
jgi:hypothetical protein